MSNLFLSKIIKYTRFLDPHHFIVLFIFSVFLLIAITTAWMSDDSLITMKEILNTINFHEISWRYGDRVQGFTHPAWFLFLLPFIKITHEIFITTITLSIVLSMAAILSIYWYIKLLVDKTIPEYILFMVSILLILSKAFTDFMTSGLENCFSYFLFGFIICISYKLFSRFSKLNILLLYLLFALSVLNRLDYVILLAPLALYIFFKHVGFRNWLLLMPGMLVLITWFVFATIYFGMPVGNTFIAKLHTGYPLSEYLSRGQDYYSITFFRDPMTIGIIILGVIAGVFNRNSFNGINRSLSLGIINYLIYILFLGGDFMIGRFFAVLVYLSIFNLIAVCCNANHKKLQVLISAGLILLLPFSHKFSFSYANYYDMAFEKNIADERGWYYQQYGLLARDRKEWPKIPPKENDLTKKVEFRVLCGAAGKSALLEPNILWLDTCALADPFISQLPGPTNSNWRVGHIERKIPTNYGDFLLGKTNQISDKQLQPLLDDVMTITKGPIFSLDRFKAIWRFNVTRPYNYDSKKYIQPGVFIPVTTLSQEKFYTYNIDINSVPLPDGTIWDSPKATRIIDKIEIKVQNIQTSGIELSLDCNDVYLVQINDNIKYSIKAATEKVANGGLVTHAIKFDQSVVVNKIVINGNSGDNSYSLGHILLKETDKNCEHVMLI